MQPLDASRSNSVLGAPSFTLANRLFRAAWSVVWCLCVAWTPPPLHGWRRLVLRLFGARIGKGARIYGSARILYPPNLSVGCYGVIGPNCQIYCMDKIVLDDYANIAQHCHLVAGTHDIDRADFQLVTKPIHIGRHAWLASSVFVGPGVSVGEGAVLGGRTVLFRDAEPWTVYVGNPARPIRKRKNFLMGESS